MFRMARFTVTEMTYRASPDCPYYLDWRGDGWSYVLMLTHLVRAGFAGVVAIDWLAAKLAGEF